MTTRTSTEYINGISETIAKIIASISSKTNMNEVYVVTEKCLQQ